MNTDNNLVNMANQIGMFFETMPDRSQAVEGFAMHIKRFWEPRMRKSLLSHVEQHGGGDLVPLAREALRTHKKLLQ